jgi:hypothetical protein
MPPWRWLRKAETCSKFTTGLTFIDPWIVIYFYSKPTRCISFSNLFILN